MKKLLASLLIAIMLMNAVPISGILNQGKSNKSANSLSIFSLAADDSKKLTTEQIIEIYLNHSSLWAQNNLTQEKYFFLDLDFDGVLELVSSLDIGRTGIHNEFYKVETASKKVLRMSTSNIYGDTYLMGMKATPELYFNSLSQGKEYRSDSGTWTSGRKPTSTTAFRSFTVDNGKVKSDLLYAEKKTTDLDNSVETYQYFIGEKEVSKTAYENARQKDKENCRDLNLKTDVIIGKDFCSANKETQRNMLLSAYKSFAYDGYNPNNDLVEVFNEKSYIADIWLNLRGGNEATTESVMIADILSYSSLSSGIYNNLKSSKSFKTALGLWKGFEAVFDTASTTKDYTFGMTELYESIIFDLLENVLEQDNTQNIIVDSVDILGKASKYVSKAKSFVDDMLGTIGTGAGNMFDLTKVSARNAGLDVNKMIKLADMQTACEKYTDNKVLEYLDGFLTESTSLADFFQMVVSFQMAVNMSIEMKTLLTTMRANTSDTYLRIALNNVISAVDNANWASFVITTRFAEDTSVNIAKKLIKHVWKSNAYSAMLKMGYDVGKTVSNLLSNTDGIIDAYYECKAMTSFVDANKKAIESLAKAYKTKKDELSASAYVYAMRMYEYIYLLDFDATLNLAKKGTEEGLINRVDKLSKSLADWIFHTEHESTYDSLLKDKNTISAVLSSNFDFLLNAWKFNENYLKKDYPPIYPIYVINEISQDVYTPKILSAYITNDGDSVLTYGFDYCYTDKKTGKTHILYGTDSYNGVEALEQIGNKKNTKTNNDVFSNSFTFSTHELLSTFPKTYSVRAFAETEKGKMYTQYSQRKLIENPCQAAKLIAYRAPIGICVGIFDTNSIRFTNTQYRIYRKTNASDYKEIGTVPRSLITGGFITLIPDIYAPKENTYSYKVITEITFNNGTVIQSSESNEITLNSTTSTNGTIEVNYTDNRNNNSIIKKAPSLFNRNATGDGIALTWNSVTSASGYEIYRKPNFGTNYTLLSTLDHNTTRFLDTTTESCVEYDYLIIPYQKGNNGQKTYTTDLFGEVSTDTDQTYLPGDINDDNNVDLLDVIQLLDYVVGKSVSVVEAALDTNGDNNIDLLDVIQLLDYVVGKDVIIK